MITKNKAKNVPIENLIEREWYEQRLCIPKRKVDKIRVDQDLEHVNISSQSVDSARIWASPLLSARPHPEAILEMHP